MKNVLVKFLPAALVWIASMFLFACNSDTTPRPDSPAEYTCVLEYAKAIYSPIPSSEPFDFKIRDINGKFIAYLDTSRLITQRADRFMGKCVVIRGILVKLDGNNVLRADSIRLLR